MALCVPSELERSLRHVLGSEWDLSLHQEWASFEAASARGTLLIVVVQRLDVAMRAQLALLKDQTPEKPSSWLQAGTLIWSVSREAWPSTSCYG